MRMLILATGLAGFVLPAMAQDYTSQRYGNTTLYQGSIQGAQHDYRGMSIFQGQVNGQDTSCTTLRFRNGMSQTNCN